MPTCLKILSVILLSLGFATPHASAQTGGDARFEVTLGDYNGSGTRHYTVVWVTTEDGTFIKSLRKQGPTSFTSSEWNSHCRTWYQAKTNNTVDGYSGATASNYSGTNSPVILSWNALDAGSALVPDGNYKFWVQYAENSGQGPYTTNGLAWTKGSSSVTSNYTNQASNFTNMKVVWTAAAPPPEPPTITSAPPTATGILAVPYMYTCTATGTEPITFSATGLPANLSMSTAGAISGLPVVSGSFNGTITARNGNLPNATQPYSILISAVPAQITAFQREGGNLVIRGQGPASGILTILGSTNPELQLGQWSPLTTLSISGSGGFIYTNAPNPGVMQQYFHLRMPN